MKLIILLLFVYSLTRAGTFYIDPTAMYNGDGSSGTPAAGPGKPGAFNAWPQYPAKPGDKYYQKCGTTFTVPWRDGIYFADKDGSAGNETVFGAYYLDGNNHVVIGVSGDKPIITGLTTLAGWQQGSNWTYLGNNVWSWEIGTTSPYRLWIDGKERLMAGLNPAVEDPATEGVARINPNATPPIYWCHDTYPPDGGGDTGTKLYVYATGNPATTYSAMLGLQAIDRIFTIRDSDHVIVENLDIRAAKICLFIDRSNEVIIQNCAIGRGGNVGILIRGTVVNGVGFTADHGVIRDCVIDSDFHFKGYQYENQGPNNGIEMKDGVNGWDIHRNAIKNWGHSGVNIFSVVNESPTLTSNNNKVHENFFTAPEASHCRAFNLTGSTMGRCANNEIYLNYIYKMPTRAQITADHNQIYYNIFDTMGNEPYFLHDDTWKTSGEGIEIWAGADNPFCAYNKIYHNVFYNTGEAGIRLMSWGQNQRVQYNEIFNNIFYRCGIVAKVGRESYQSRGHAGAALVIEAWRVEDDGMLSNNLFRNNLIYNTASGNDVHYKGRAMTVSIFNASAQDSDVIADNLQASPHFMDPANGNFALLSSSAAIGKGFNLGRAYESAIAPGMTRRDWPGAILVIPQSLPWDIGAFKYGAVTAIEEQSENFILQQNYPNPFNPGTKITFEVLTPAHVKLKVYGLNGEEVKILIDEDKAPGPYEVTWNGQNDRGEKLASGVYFYRFEISQNGSMQLFSKMKKMLLLR